MATEDYEYGFHDDVKPVFSTGKGLNEKIIRQISAEKPEREFVFGHL